MPSSKCIGRKKITNNREKTGKKPGAQAGHPHHPRKSMGPARVIEIPVEEKLKDPSRYVPTGNIISRQVIGIAVVPVVTEYRAMEFYDKKKGRNIHAAFPCGVKDDVNYDESLKAFLFPLNSRCNVSLEKTAQFVSDITDGALPPSVGMINACFYSYGCDHQECMARIERHLRDSIENEKNLTWNGQMFALIQEMIHENNTAPAEGIADEKISEFEARYDAIVRTATKEYEDDPPSDYYRDGYNLYLRMIEYKHNHLLFLSNPLVAPDNNLCERKARILKGKINQAISLRSFGHLIYFCECLSVLDHFATDNKDNLYQSVQEIFKRPRPDKPRSEKTKSSNEV